MPSQQLPPTYTPKRDSFYLFEGLYTRLVCKLLPTIARTRLTPNQVTLLNIGNSLLIAFLLLKSLWFPASLLIQLYLILDILDGNLARYTRLSSKFGQILDQIADRLFYTGGFLVLGYSTGNSTSWLIAYAFVINAYAILTTFYIVPRLRSLPSVQRWGLKKAFMQKKILFGMDLSTQDVIASLLLLTPWKAAILPAITLLYAADSLYRLWELKRNESLIAPNHA
ncbi:CDP-alcohol phosphatidyltransferase family protein [Pelagicoccus sp. SDUM812003]|uniref:CDP-alcohol phosphatidyltransferase family protein n=1 Tax=Pelagicoccus sp. SDUM812003 TaxID=3041267 RepID=UPI00280C7EB2|nr:CDP-alcohol phosphatidyltransferase family protein [Pelagicoccus sp. SDUM812003]MDQ8201578.1 CDP-alcohol phosphatidyltransferase family protein [Pelagicoccus sp. SDUM812003]